MHPKARPAFSLVEVLVALVLLGVSGGAYLSLLTASQEQIARAASLEREVVEANALLTRVAQEPVVAVERRVGRQRIGNLLLTVSHRGNGLFAIEAVDAESGRALLATLLYRPDGRRSAP
jgi:prepilin-type N-terminal cleavage/methylation domain-containing protein